MAASHQDFDVFLCYAGENKVFVRQLVNRLEKDGLKQERIFYDEISLQPGDELDSIIKVIESPSLKLFVFVVSKYCFLSNKTWIRAEWEAALKNNKEIFPIWLDDNNDGFKAFGNLVREFSYNLKKIIAERVNPQEISTSLDALSKKICSLVFGDQQTHQPSRNVGLSSARQNLMPDSLPVMLNFQKSYIQLLDKVEALFGKDTLTEEDRLKEANKTLLRFRAEISSKPGGELENMFFRFSQKVTQTVEVEALATVTGLTANEKTSILGKDKTNPSNQANNVLLKWMEKDREASMDKLQQRLSDIGLDQLAQEAGRIKTERLKWPAEAGGLAAAGSSDEGHQEIRQAEQKLVRLQHRIETHHTVHSLRAEVTRLRDKEEKAQKVLLDHKLEIQQLQEANVAMATRVNDLLQDNEKLRSQVVLFGGEHADEQTVQVLEQTILMFTENIEESELATAAESHLLRKLSCRLGSDWRRLGAGLGIPQPRLDSIQAQYNSAIQRACRVLQVWMWGGRHGLPHDFKQLETVLKDMDRPDLLDIVKTAFKDYIEEMQEVEVEPNVSVDEQGVTTWSVELPGRGTFLCKHTDLGVVTPCPIQLTYRTVNPSEHWPGSEDWELIGPLFHIQCNHGDDVPVELLLPHVLDLSEEDGSALKTPDDVRAAHVVAGNTTLHPADVTPTHCITRHRKGSLWGSVMQRLRALSVNRRGLFTLFKASPTQDAVDVKAHIVTNTKDMVKTLQEDLSQLVPPFYPWDSLPCSFRPHRIYCLQASVENGTLAHAEPEPPEGLEYEDTFDRNRFYPSFHMAVHRVLDRERLQHPQLTLMLYQAEDNSVVCRCTRDLYDGAAAGPRGIEDVRRHFFFIKEKVSVHWRDVAHLLDFTRSDIDNIQYKQANRDAKDCCMDMLEQWRKRRGNAATLQVLLQALTKAGLQDIVDELNTM
ncbi:uncharacterized protein LOC144925355 [Branchiostoma floridae x Branchiostoma belcheri]